MRADPNKVPVQTPAEKQAAQVEADRLKQIEADKQH